MNELEYYSLGIDIGSTTVKIACRIVVAIKSYVS